MSKYVIQVLRFPFGYRAKKGGQAGKITTHDPLKAKIFKSYEDAERLLRPQERVVDYDALGLEDDDDDESDTDL